MYTNINIISGDKKFDYVIEYCDNNNLTDIINTQYIKYKENNIQFYNGGYIRNKNIWNKIDPLKTVDCEYISREDPMSYIPEKVYMSYIRIYFPQYSVDTYNRNVKYALNLNIWVQNCMISLGTFILNRLDCIACTRPLHKNGKIYYEYIELPIINPKHLMYFDEWTEFRDKICNDVTYTDLTFNSAGSSMNISLYPVMENDEKYIMLDEYTGGQNSIRLADLDTDFLGLNIKSNVDIPFQCPAINCQIVFNDMYKGILYDYIYHIYNLNNFNIQYNLVIGNQSDIYCMQSSDIIKCDPNTPLTYSFSNIFFKNGLGWKEGIKIEVSLDIKDENNNEILYVLSNELMLTEELFKYFNNAAFKTKDKLLYNINLNDINMNIYNINAVNKIQNNIIKLNRPADSKSNIIQPVFFKSFELNDLIIYPKITSTISLNLDIYKSKVDYFILQIEDCVFVEMGRTGAGVLFKIIGNQLPKKETAGIYYILNQDKELVTTGKYNYIM